MEDLLLSSSQKSSTSTVKRPSLKYEECLINGEKMKLPQALCENTELFQVLFSVDSWNAFTEQQRRHLMQFLPNFEENDAEEKSCTLKRLFSGDDFRFGLNPLTEFCDKLNAGFYRTDIVNMQKLLMKARYREYLKKQRIYYYKVLKHSLTTRHKLLENASDLQIDCSLPTASTGTSPSNLKRKMERISLEKRIKHRYFQELSSIKKEIGDSSDSSYDENYPEGFVPPPFTKKHRRQICVLEESFNSEFEQPTISTLSRPDCLDLSRLVLNVDNPFDMTEDKYKEMMKQYHKHNRSLHPHLKIQKKSKPAKVPVLPKVSKEIKPTRKRRTKKAATNVAPKPSPKLLEPVESESYAISDGFSNPGSSNSTFSFINQDREKKFEPMKIKTEIDEYPKVKTEPGLVEEENLIKNELAMKEEQDNAVAALLKQEEEEAKVNEYIKNEESKSSVLLFDEFNHHNDVVVDKTQSEFLLTPESYNVALHSVVTNESSSFVESSTSNDKPAAETSNISVVDNLTFEPLSIDTIAETTFTTSPSVTSCISACGNVIAGTRISPSVTDLDNMNVMDLGPMNVEETEPPPTRDKPPPELMRNAHTCFFSLIREIVCSTWDHRMDLRNLQKRVDTWYDNAVSPLNSWYTNESWPNLLQNAVTFLAGQCPDDLLPPEYVPYIEYKANLDIYQWIGAGRDSDTKLTMLCETWLKNKDDVAARMVEDEAILPFVLHHEEFDFKREQRAVSPASTRFPTDWVVKSSSYEEKEDFRKQERARFHNPNTPFTYRIHGYQTVVGPVNMNHALPNNAKLNKGSSLLVENRPYFVTILALVQDAAARLPNGEGTRQDIVTLLKDSQYLSQNIMNCILHGAVTYALERLQLESDPCVKYDARRKVWIYLHRSRTISDFEMIEAVKPKTSRKTPVWKLRKDYVPVSNVTSLKPDFRTVDNVNARPTKESKTNVRTIKNASTGKSNESKAAAKRTSNAQRNIKEDKSKLTNQPTIIQAVIQENICQNLESLSEPQIISLQAANTIDNTRTILRAAEVKNIAKTVTKATRPSIIKKAIIKDSGSTSTASIVNKASITDTKSIITGSSLLSPNTIVKLINAKSLSTTDAVKGAKTIAQIAPQQIVVIKQQEDNVDKKHAVLLKQLQQHAQNQQRLSLSNLQKTSRQTQIEQQSLVNVDIRNCNLLESRTSEISTGSNLTDNTSTKQDLMEKHQKQLQPLLVKHQNELKLQQSPANKEQQQTIQSVTIQQSKNLPKQMIVIKQNQGQIVAETQSVVNDEESALQNPKHIASPVVILNKQQYQQQISNQKHQIIHLPSQQISAQQIQQLLLKQQQQQPLKRANQQQQIVMLKPDVQQQGQQQIVMLKQQSQPQQPQQQQQQQLVMIKQSTQPNQKIQQKQSQPQIIQIANSGGIISPISTDITKLQAAVSTSSTARLQKIQTSVTPTLIQNSKSATGSGTTLSVSVSKPSMPTYTVVALGQQQKMFTQNNQNVQILTPATGAMNSNQTVVLPTTSGAALTLLQQTPMQQVLLPSTFNAPGMINLKTLQGLKVIPISTQNAGSLRGQPVFTRLVNSNTIRPVVIQEDLNTSNSSNSNVTPQ